MPNRGIRKNTNIIRIRVETIFVKKVKPVFPSPLIIALRDVFVYKNGQIKLNDIINVPARELWNRSLPNNFPRAKKTKKQKKPRSIQKEMDFFSVFFRFPWVFSAFCSETAGRSMEDKEFVMAVGNIIRGRAIPDKTPNKLNASSVP